ncbi:MAG: DnaB-like helicase N-terminal domain-containing protein, partial [Mariprofundaceae bacterium]|nr:DnaB-like helicase N-terminal domain-containing protein [Mariprofundaceae bacterium]
MREHVPPHAMDAELAVLGGIMLDPEALERLEGSIIPEHFYVERHRLIFGAMLELSAKGQPVDSLTIKDYLEQRSLLDSCGGE